MGTLSLSHREAIIVLSALQLCTPSGGGGENHSLFQKVAAAFPEIDLGELRTTEFWNTAVAEWEEASGLKLPR